MKKLALVILCTFAVSALWAAQINVMLLTGKTDKHHNWKIMSKCVTDILATNDHFDVEVVTYTSAESFAPDFKRADVVIVNLNSVTWSDECKLSFESYVKGGGGVVILHEANNAFAEWEGYNRIIGLGGWGGRTKESGGYYYYKDGKMVHDTQSDGRSGHHGKAGDFVINVRNSKHPIMKGLPQSWTHHQDELYGDLRGPALEMDILATAYSDPATKGTGKEEPVLFTVRYGKGRIFHTVLGHTGSRWTAAQEGDKIRSVGNEGFKTTLLRGTEWAATGKVRRTR